MRWIAAIYFLAAGLGYLAWLALVPPETEFLRPSLRGDWIVHPASLIRSHGSPVCPDAIFERRVVVTNLPAALEVSVYAFRGFSLDVNGQTALVVGEGANWKRPVRTNLLPHLHLGTNVLKATAFGTDGPPALLIEGPAAFRSGTNWTVRTEGARPIQAVIACRGEGYMRERESALWRHGNHRLFGWLFAAYAAFILYALVPVRFKPWLRGNASEGAVSGIDPSATAPEERPPCRPTSMGERSEGSPSRRLFLATWGFLARYGICLVILLAVAIAQYRNTAVYPHTRSPFDVGGHVEYLRLAAEKRVVPMATDGWEMFQPPGYYFAAAIVYRLWGGRQAEPQSLKAVQVFTTTCGLLTLAFTLGLLWLLLPDRPLARNLGFASVAFLPVHFYMNPMITNEVFAGAVVSGALLAVCWAMRNVRPSWMGVGAAALACGAALLSKYSGLFLFLAAATWLGLRALSKPRNVRDWAVLLVFAVCVLAVCGWYYQRNAAAYGNVFIGNWDQASGFHYEQPPGYRTAGFYTRFGSVFLNHPERSRWASFWDGQYGSIWADSHSAFLGKGGQKTDLPVATIVCLALLPTVACLLGFLGGVRHLLRRKWDDPLLAVVLVTLLSIVGVIAFTIEVPTYSTIKGFFLLSLTPAAAVFSGMGFETMARQAGRLRWVMFGCMAALCVLVLHTYRFAG